MSAYIIAATGHRPDKILHAGKNAYQPSTRGALYLFALDMVALAHRRRGENVIWRVGMAQGWDMAIASACEFTKTPYHAYIPFVGQELRWPTAAQEEYHKLLERASATTVVCEGGYAAWKMQRRNEAMVDGADCVLALWDGSSGGTANCVAYAQRRDVPVGNVWSRWHRYEVE